MALTGQLSDLSLAELIEFFCNQRKTGRLKVDYHKGHGVFFIKDGELVDAKLGALNGAEAVYFALTLPNAAFDFSPDFQPTRRTINEPWTQVVLEGLRRLDEGLPSAEMEAYGTEDQPAADSSAHTTYSEPVEEVRAAEVSTVKDDTSSEVPLSMMVDSASGGGGRRKMIMIGVVGAVILVCVTAAIPLGWFGSNKAPARPAPTTTAAAAQHEATPSNIEGSTGLSDPTATQPSEDASAEQPEAAAAPTDNTAAAALAARREREAREARERQRRAEELARKAGSTPTTPSTPAATTASGPKSVRVSVTYDEAGRVTQASVAGSSPGAEAYASTAVRIARGRRFPAGKPGSTVVTIPIN